MLPLKELAMICSIIAAPQICLKFPSLYHSIVSVDTRGRILPEFRDSRRDSRYFAHEKPVTQEAVEWYRHKFHVEISRDDVEAAPADEANCHSADSNQLAIGLLSELEIQTARLPAL